MNKAGIVEKFKDAKALITDLATNLYVAPREMYRSLRNGYDVFGHDPKDPLSTVPAIRAVVSNPTNPVVATLAVAGMELFKMSTGSALGWYATSLSNIGSAHPTNAVVGALVGGLISKVLVDSVGAFMGDSHAGTGHPTLPRTQARTGSAQLFNS